VPFEIPESWEWTTIGEIASSILYGVSESSKDNGKYKLLRITDIQNNKVNWDNVPFTDFDDNKAKSYLLQNGDILFARTGATVGKSYLVEGLSHLSIYASYLIRVQTSNTILPAYIKYFFESGFYWEQISLNSIGIGQPNVNGTTLSNLLVPIPPYCEQKRIVDEADSWLNVIDTLDNDIFDLKSKINFTKSKILDLAISGKLVPQDPNDEPAIELLKRINPDFEPCDNSHYENMVIPESWEMVSMNNIVDIISGVSFTKMDIKKCGIRILRGGNIQDGEIVCLDDDVYVDVSYSNNINSIIEGDIVLVASTGSSTLIGKTGYARTTYQNTQIGAFLRIIRPKSINISGYLNLIFNSNYYKNYIRSLAKGTNINNVKNGYIEQFMVALPPIQEQNRIVSMVNNIFTKLNIITAEL
jgi:type I restriction enzyme S subunit